MTDYTALRMRVSWVLVSLCAFNLALSTAEQQLPLAPGDEPLSAAALTLARSLQTDNRSSPRARSATQEVDIGGTTLIVRRRAKTPHSLEVNLPKPVYITSAPLNVKGNNDASSGNSRSGRKIELGSDGIPVIHGIRVPDDEDDKIHTWRNARVIKGVLVPYENNGNNRGARQARVLHSGPMEIRPPVLDQGAAAVRSPVLQYAHPELGAQPALSAPSRPEAVPEVMPTAQAVVYFARDNPQDIHNDHSPYPFEPAELTQRVPEEPALQRPYDKRYQKYELGLRPKKTLPYQFTDNAEDNYGSKYNKRQQFVYNAWNKENSRYKYLPSSEFDQSTYASYYSPEERPFWERIGEVIRERVQSGVARMTDLARPVMDPIMSASQTFSENFGLGSRSTAQDKVGVVGPLLMGTNPMVLPAIGLVAGGAALGLGAAAMGRYLESAHGDDSRSRIKRSLITGGRPLVSLQEQGEEHQYLDNMLHGLESTQEAFLSKLSRYGHYSWSDDTPCAKRIFCDVMTQQPEDAVILMEKRMETFISMIHPSVARSLSHHLGDVMDAVRRRDCSAFTCSAEEKGRRAGAVTGSAVEAPGGGPGPR